MGLSVFQQHLADCGWSGLFGGSGKATATTSLTVSSERFSIEAPMTVAEGGQKPDRVVANPRKNDPVVRYFEPS
ncbi:MAG: hypothetical protein O9253_01330 [Aquidulcibacter sp.]|nr:hypothetical protein [Aquidulcibacter sp.]